MSSRPEWPEDEHPPDEELPPAAGRRGADDTSASPGVEGPPRTPATQQIGRVVVLALVGVFLVFALANSQPVDFSWLLGGTEVSRDPASGERSGGVPLIVLLLVAFLIGAVVGAAAARARRRRRAARSNEQFH